VETPTAPLEPPNSSQVTTRDLYAALYQMDQRLADRDTAFMNQMTGVSAAIENHRSDREVHGRAEVLKEEIKLDAKKVGLGTAALAAFAAFATFLTALIKGKWGL